MKITSIFWKVCLFSFLMGSGFADPNDDYSNGLIPNPPCPFPEQFKDYQILPSSISPDQKFALIYPKRSVLYKLKEHSLYLVDLNPFRILTIIPLRWSNLTENAHGWYRVNWSKDSSAVLVVEGAKWGADKVYLVTVKYGNAGSITDLTQQVTSEVESDFLHSKASRFNDFYEFWIDGGSSGWIFLNNNQIQIRNECSSDPKGLEKNPWTVRFEGVWDISKGDFTSRKITPLSKTPSSK